MNRYAKGAAFEREVVKWLRDLGWKAYRTAGSHGEPDVIALKDGKRAHIIQCKTDGKLPIDEWNALWKAAVDADAEAILVERPRGGKIIAWAIVGYRQPRDGQRCRMKYYGLEREE
jgi:Holliday junction resolvase